jgi:hypothetical protein
LEARRGGAPLWASQAKLIEALLGVGDLDGALAVPVSADLLSELAATKRRAPDSEMALLDVASLRAEALLRKRRFPEAEALLRSVIARGRHVKYYGQYRDITALAEVLAERGAVGEANLLLSTAGAGSQDFRRLTAYRGAQIYVSQGRRDKAKAWLADSRVAPGYLPWDFGGGVRGVAMLARFHREDGTKDSTDTLRTLLSDIDKTPYVDNSDTAELVTELAKQLRGRGQHSEARALLIRALRVWKRTYPISAERSIEGHANLAEQLASVPRDRAAARTLYRAAAVGIMGRLALSSGFDKAAQQTLLKYRPVFIDQVRLAWRLSADSQLTPLARQDTISSKPGPYGQGGRRSVQ